MGVYEAATELAILSASRTVAWEDQEVAPMAAGTTDNFPDSQSAGMYLQNGVKATISAHCREAVHRRQATYSITTFDSASTYTCTIAGTAVAQSAAAHTRADETLRALGAAIEADGTAGLVVTATPINEAGEDVTAITYDATSTETVTNTSAVALVIAGQGSADYSVATSVTAGTGTVSTHADPAEFSMRLYATKKGSDDLSQWAQLNGSDITVTSRGYLERATINGFQRLYAEVYNCVAVAGDGSEILYQPTVIMGPGILEG